MMSMLDFVKKLFDLNSRELGRLRRFVEQINRLEPEVAKLKREEFLQQTERFRDKALANKLSQEDWFYAFALVRQAAKLTVSMRHFDVQLMAAWALAEGKIAEQKTGEGKTLSAVPALYINALYGKGAHLVTVNDYLAKRDAGWMGPIFDFLGLSVGVIVHDQAFLYDPSYTDPKALEERLAHLRPVSRREAYLADVTYGTNNEFGFDYLRDNMVASFSEKVQRGHFYSIVDEVDSILIDEARTPLIISAPDEEDTSMYLRFAQLASQLLKDRDYEIDEKRKTVSLTDFGMRKVEKTLGVSNLYQENFQMVHHLEQALKAKELFHKDKEYIVKDNQIIIVDEHTGRLMPGRRFSEGLHQALEAKEGVPIQKRSKTMATISLQNYFRMYQKLAGMTGTAATEAEEFDKIYHLTTVVIPTNKPVIRRDYPDRVYKTTRAKFSAIVREVEELHQKGQPVLVGTRSIEMNQILSNLLKHKGIPHQVLNAKHHEQEAQIIAQAGKPGSVTVATNMAGRGVDIVLGGALPEKKKGQSEEEYLKSRAYQEWLRRHQQVVEAGGLAVIGSERHEARRIDNQLRGRSGRQGDPGMSRFYVSLEDEIMRIFGGDQISRLMTMFNLPEDQPLEHSLVSRALEQAQTKVESFYFDIRKSLVDYDDVINKQRQIIYKRRDKILLLAEKEPQKLVEEINKLLQTYLDHLIEFYFEEEKLSEDEAKELVKEYTKIIPLDKESSQFLVDQLTGQSKTGVKEVLEELGQKAIKAKEGQFGPEILQDIARVSLLKSIDDFWVDHIDLLDQLREGVMVRGFAQKDPLVEYKQEAFRLFERLIRLIEKESLFSFYHLVPQRIPQESLLDKPIVTQGPADSSLGSLAEFNPQTAAAGEVNPIQTQQTVHRYKLGRNDPCWCGSGKKWKKCHYPQLPPPGWKPPENGTRQK